MSPLWSILNDQARSGEKRPVRFFYGARTRADSFMLDEIAAVGATIGDFEFIPALSHSATTTDGRAKQASSTRCSRGTFARGGADAEDAYTCGPPPMIDAVLPSCT